MNRRYFLLGLFLFVLYWVWFLYRPFLLPLSIASLLALATSSLNRYLDRYVRHRFTKAIVLTLLLGVLFFAPLIYLMNSLAVLVNHFDTGAIDKIVAMKKSFVLPDYLAFAKPKIKELLNAINTQNIAAGMLKISTLIVQKSAGFLKDMVMILVFYFFANLYSSELIRYIKEILPFDEDSTFYAEISHVMNIVFYSTLITAIFEGALFAIIAMIYGYDGLLFGILYGFASLVPVVGGMLMWLPLSLYEYANGQTGHAVIIALYSIVVISLIADTFVKPIIIKYVGSTMVRATTKMNELLIFFSIIAGLSTFGFWGMVLGPAITTFFVSFLKIYSTLLEEEKRNAR